MLPRAIASATLLEALVEWQRVEGERGGCIGELTLGSLRTLEETYRENLPGLFLDMFIVHNSEVEPYVLEALRMADAAADARQPPPAGGAVPLAAPLRHELEPPS